MGAVILTGVVADQILECRTRQYKQKYLTARAGNRMELMGIDVGTGGTRAVVVDERGSVVASATADHVAFASPQTGWAEQDPRDWWRAAAEAVREVLAQPGVSADSIACIGFSGQMHGAVLL